MKNMKNTEFFALLLFLHESYGYKIFHRGRLTGGNLRIPNNEVDDLDNSEAIHVQENWFTQRLNHFDSNDGRTWQQRYLVNERYYDSSKRDAVFLEIGGEGAVSSEWLKRGEMMDNAKKFGAMSFLLEHRYYGNSRPTSDLSTENLQYLTTQQVLADIANFISAMNQMYEFPIYIKWIAFGGSYSGTLAAWLRLKYPHLVHGAVSSSGVFLTKPDYSDYFRIVAESLRTYNEDCVRNVEVAMAEMDVLLYRENNTDYLKSLFHACDLSEEFLHNQHDIATLYDAIAGKIGSIVQYNKDNFIGENPITIDTICKTMTNQKRGTRIERLAAVNKLIITYFDGDYCVDYQYDHLINYFKNIDWNSKAVLGGDRQWVYQTCTELGFLQTSSHGPYVFGNHFPLEFYVKQCADIFGPIYNLEYINSATKRTRSLYGGLNINVTNVVFIYGSIDPWRGAGLPKTVNPLAPVIYIDGTAHCADMYPPSKADLPQLKEARKQVSKYISQWI